MPDFNEVDDFELRLLASQYILQVRLESLVTTLGFGGAHIPPSLEDFVTHMERIFDLKRMGVDTSEFREIKILREALHERIEEDIEELWEICGDSQVAEDFAAWGKEFEESDG